MAAGSTYTPIATNTLGSAASTVTFSSIAGTYTDLVLISNTKFTTPSIPTGNALWLQFNGDTATNYSDTYMYGDGTSAASGRVGSTTTFFVGNSDGTNFNITKTNIFNYANTTTYKTALSRSDTPAAYAVSYVSLWRSTAAITSILIGNSTGSTFTAGSTFTLYGIASA